MSNLRSTVLNRRSILLNVRSELLNLRSKLLNEDFFKESRTFHIGFTESGTRRERNKMNNRIGV